ncbi:MAG: xanthine dehydrogenase accessory protein XdhC [Alphaproteobacteria bacterium]
MTERIAAEVERLVAAGEPVVLVTVADARGSTPRAAGTRMAVAAETIHGTIGGGRLEWEAIGRARAMIAAGETIGTFDMPLGPAVGQCCGGHVVLRLDRADAAALAGLAATETQERQAEPQIVVFGAGHVGKALVRALAPLPVRVLWSDARPEAFPPEVGDGVDVDAGGAADTVDRADQGAAVVVMTHSHALDYAITEAALLRDDLAYVGLIGSRTKRRRFERWFCARGGDARALDRLVSPIGDAGVIDKRPAVIAALVTAEIVQALGRQERLCVEPVEDSHRREAVK